jgi:uncharacterized membrane protein YdjX (TVP38/TMEM64 family)
MRACIVLLTLLAVIVCPFFLFGEDLARVVERLVRADTTQGALAACIVSLLAIDVFLPVPSSIVSTAAGAFLGFVAGTIVSTAGMTLGCMIAYLCGRRFGLPLLRRMVRERDLETLSARFRGSAEWALATVRPVPVLAEASALFAGVAGVPMSRYVSVTALANAGISAVYCAAGAKALETESFLFALAGSVGLPGCVILLRTAMLRRDACRVRSGQANEVQR